MGIFKTLTVGGTTFELAPAISNDGGLEFDSERKLRVKIYSDSSLKFGVNGLYLDTQRSHTIKDLPQGLEVLFNPYTMKYDENGLDIYINDYLFKGNLTEFRDGLLVTSEGRVVYPEIGTPTPLGLATFVYREYQCLGVSLWGNTNRPMVRDYISGISDVAPLAFVKSYNDGNPLSIGVPIYSAANSAEVGVNPIQMNEYGLFIDCFYMAKCVAGLLRTSDNKTLTARRYNE